jgi:hypothetical protein
MHIRDPRLVAVRSIRENQDNGNGYLVARFGGFGGPPVNSGMAWWLADPHNHQVWPTPRHLPPVLRTPYCVPRPGRRVSSLILAHTASTHFERIYHSFASHRYVSSSAATSFWSTNPALSPTVGFLIYSFQEQRRTHASPAQSFKDLTGTPRQSDA